MSENHPTSTSPEPPSPASGVAASGSPTGWLRRRPLWLGALLVLTAAVLVRWLGCGGFGKGWECAPGHVACGDICIAATQPCPPPGDLGLATAPDDLDPRTDLSSLADFGVADLGASDFGAADLGAPVDLSVWPPDASRPPDAASAPDLLSPAANYYLRFNGSDGYVQLGNNLAPDISSAITITVWFYLEDKTVPSHPRLISKGADKAGYEIKHLLDLTTPPSSTAGRLQFLIAPGILTSTTAPQLDRWYHLAVTYDGTQIALYLDGVLDAAVPASGLVSRNSERLCFGQKSSWAWDKFKGSLDEMSLWRIALSPEQIRQVMQNGLSGNETGLVGYWPFDEGGGLTTADKSANGNHGTLQGGVTWVPAPARLTPGSLR